MHHALVTGGSGFIGRHLVKELVRQGVHVKCLVRRCSRIDHLSEMGVELVSGDLLDANELRRAVSDVDVVFHSAGLTHAISEAQLDQVNGAGCGVLADACRQVSNPPRLVYLSSLSAAGPARFDLPPLCEEDSPVPISKYGRSKRRGEIEIQKRAADLPCTIVRPGIVFGPHDPGTVSIMHPIYHYRLHFIVGFRTPPLSLIFVEDLLRLLLQAATRGECLIGDSEGDYSAQGYYFACDDSEYPNYWQLGKRVATALDRRVFVWPLWRWVGRTLGFSCETANRMRGKSSLLNVDKIIEGTVLSWACSAAKARRQLDFAPAQNIDTALKKTADWYVQSLRVADPQAASAITESLGSTRRPCKS